MARKQLITVLDLDADRLTALHADIVGSGVTLRNWVTATRPENIPAENLPAVGGWIQQQLDSAGMSRGQLVLSMGRSDVVLKKLSFPAGAGGLAGEDLAGMVRLQMSRQLTMPVDSAAIDYAPMGDPGTPGPDGQVSVIAGAMPGERLEWCNGLATALRMKIARVSLRASGAAALVREFSQRHERPTIAVVLGYRTAEFVIVEDGNLVFARAADAPRPPTDSDLDAYAERVAVELRRTWTSYRMATPNDRAPLVAVLAEGPLAKAVGERCGAAVEGGWEAVHWPSSIDSLAGVASADPAAITPLVGLLHEIALDRPAIDFAHPKKAPDRRAATRQRSLLAALAAIVLLGGGWAFAHVQIGTLQSQLDRLRAQEASLRTDLDSFMVEHARVNHVETWTSAKVDWLSHLETLDRQLPDPRQSLVDEITGSLKSPIKFAAKGPYPQGAWSIDPVVEFGLGGKVANRDVAAELRGRLISSNLYEVESRGADVADRYSLHLTTTYRQPSSAARPPAAPNSAGGETPATPGGAAAPAPGAAPSDPKAIVTPAPPPQPATATPKPAAKTDAKTPAKKPPAKNAKPTDKPAAGKSAPNAAGGSQ